MNPDKIKAIILNCIDVYSPKNPQELFKYVSALNVALNEFKDGLKELRKDNRFKTADDHLITVPVPELNNEIQRKKPSELAKVEEKGEPLSEERLKEITKEMSIKDLKDVLGSTIKHDDSNKSITFLNMLSAYSENNQSNISYRAPSSTGKSYIPLELADYFPAEDVISIGYASPTSFFHEFGLWDDERKVIINDLERKILIFMDQPHDLLLQRLRPFLSHDKKEISLKITDRTEKYGMRTKTALLRGYSAVIFCTGSLKIDEQEATRNFLLSPETTQEKLREAIYLKAFKRGNRPAYNEWIEKDEKRKMLKDRIRLIKEAKISEIIIPNVDKVVERFKKQTDKLKPRHQRDIDRIIALIGDFALFNLWNRKREGNNIYSNQNDIDNAFALWDSVAVCQELNIPPYVWRIYEEVIKPAYQGLNDIKVLIHQIHEKYGNVKFLKSELKEFQENIDYFLKNGIIFEPDKDSYQICEPDNLEEKVKGMEDNQTRIGISRKDIKKKFYEVYGRSISDDSLRREILPLLETAGLVIQEPNPDDKRQELTFVI